MAAERRLTNFDTAPVGRPSLSSQSHMSESVLEQRCVAWTVDLQRAHCLAALVLPNFPFSPVGQDAWKRTCCYYNITIIDN
jgi:hypothetical protein